MSISDADEQKVREWLRHLMEPGATSKAGASHAATLLALLDAAEAGAAAVKRFTVEEVKTLTDDTERHARDAALEESERIAEAHAKIGASTPADVLQDIRALRGKA
jgi:oligoendopeptidase F